MREQFEERLFRIIAVAGHSRQPLATPKEMVEVPGVTVPNIRAIDQNKLLAEGDTVREGQLIVALKNKIEESEDNINE